MKKITRTESSAEAPPDRIARRISGPLRVLMMSVLPLAFLVLSVIGYREITKPQTGVKGNGEQAGQRKGPWGPRYGRSRVSAGRESKKPVAVAAKTIRLASYTPRFDLFGQVIASHRVAMGMAVSGRIIKVNPRLQEGARVQKGEFLVAVDDFPYRANLEEIRSNRAEAKAKIRETEAQLALEQETFRLLQHQLKLARREQKRAEKLILQRTIPQKILDDAVLLVSQREVALQQRRSNIEIARARIDQQKAVENRLGWSVKKAERTLSDTRLVAPFSGRILLVNAEIGQHVSSADKLVNLVSDSHLEVRFTLSEDRYGELLSTGGRPVIGLPVRITWKSGRMSKNFNGRLTRIAPEIAPESGAIIAFAGFEDGGEAADLLRIGSFVDVRLSGHRIENVARIPESALYDENRVYLIRGRQLVPRKVRAVRWENGEVMISSGLEEGERILVNHLPNIRPDMRVKVVEE